LRTIHLGLDETDSLRGGCTTHLSTHLLKEVLASGGRFIDFPGLVRLNPDIPWKTRGNGAVSLRFQLDSDGIDTLFNELVRVLEEYVGENEEDSGMVAYVGEYPPASVKELSERALHDVVPMGDALKLLQSPGFLWHKRGNGRGLVGALSAIGNPLVDTDHTYEVLAYRSTREVGTERRIDETSVLEASRDPETFANVDPETGRMLVAPRGPDPVLMGVRGESPEVVYNAFRRMVVREEVDRWVMFVTNQGTGCHLTVERGIGELEPYQQAVVAGLLDEDPAVLRGGHTVLRVRDDGGCVPCLAYAPSGELSRRVRSLKKGDGVEVAGGVKPKDGGLTLNLERIRILDVEPTRIVTPPICVRCGKRMTSLGLGKGHVCRRCGYHLEEAGQNTYSVDRPFHPRVLITPYRSMRHLTKPLKRYGRSNMRDKMGITFHPWTSLVEGVPGP
jgi:tRNA(Ile2)-agmatinylcytidine synthase